MVENSRKGRLIGDFIGMLSWKVKELSLIHI